MWRLLILTALAAAAALLAAACGTDAPQPPVASPSPTSFPSATALRAQLTADWSEAPRSLRADLVTLPGAATCDVYANDPHGSATASDGTRKSNVLFAVYPSPPTEGVLARADKRVRWRSAYGDALYRLSGSNWAIWSASRSTLGEFQHAVGGELVLLHEAGESSARGGKAVAG